MKRMSHLLLVTLCSLALLLAAGGCSDDDDNKSNGEEGEGEGEEGEGEEGEGEEGEGEEGEGEEGEGEEGEGEEGEGEEGEGEEGEGEEGEGEPLECDADAEAFFGGLQEVGCDTLVGVCEGTPNPDPAQAEAYFPCVDDPDCCCRLDEVIVEEMGLYGCENDSCTEDGFCDDTCPEGVDPDC